MTEIIFGIAIKANDKSIRLITKFTDEIAEKRYLLSKYNYK